jgi:tetratricopeptide (TPR) repeat protein
MADPFTAIGIGVNILQIVTLATTLATKLWKFTSDHAVLPQNLETIKQRLDIMAFTLKELDTSEYSEEASQSLEAYLAGMDKKLLRLQKMLEQYLPETGASTMDRLKKGFQSLGKDSRVAEFADELSKDVDHLTLFLMTQSLSKPKSDPASHLKGRVIYQVARRRVAKFIGREEHIAALDVALGSTAQIAVLQGVGGQGKTQIALEYCRRGRITKKYKAIMWANASSEQSLRDSFEAFSDLLKNPDDSIVDSESRVRYTKQMLTDWPEPWLLVFDNFDDPSKFAIRDYIPSSLLGHIIITTRAADITALGIGIPVTGMTDAEALHLLMVSGNLVQADETNIKEGSKITKRLGNMPLAIDLAGAYLARRAGLVRIQDFLPRYDAQAEAILQVTPGVSEYANDLRQNETSVFATWEMTVRLLDPETELGAQKIDFLNILGFFNNEDISEDLFRTYYVKKRKMEDVPQWFSLFTDERGEWRPLAFEDLITQLSMINLVERPSRNTAGMVQFSIHPLISDWLRIRQTRDNHTLGMKNYQLSAEMLAYRLMDNYLEFLLQPAFKMPFREQNAISSHLLFRENFVDNFRNRKPVFLGVSEPIRCVELVFVMYLYDVGLCPNSLTIAERLWKDCGVSTREGRIVKRAAGAYLWHNRCTIHSHDAAEKRMREVATFWSETLGPTHSFTLEALYYAAASLSYLGDMDGAAKIYKDIVSNESDEWSQSCKENVWFPRPEWSLVELIYVLGAQRSASKKTEIPPITKKLLDMRVQSPTVRHGSTEWNWRSYSMIIKTLDDKVVSSSLAWELLSIIEKCWGKTHSNYFLAQIAVMEALLQRENEASSERILNHLLQSADRAQFSRSFRFLLWGLQNLSQMLLDRNRLADAEKVLRQMLNIYEDLPDAQSAQDSVLKDLGRCLYLQGRPESADDALSLISSPSLDVLILHALAKYKIGAEEKIDEAIKLLEKALEYFKIGEEGSGPSDVGAAGFSLEMMLTGADDSAPRRKYKMDVNGSVSFEVLVLLGLCQLRINDVENGRVSITDGEMAFEESGEDEAGLTADFCTFIADRAQELLVWLQAQEPPSLDKDAAEEVVSLLGWAIKQALDHIPSNTDLFERLKGLQQDIRGTGDDPRKLVDDVSTISLEDKEKKSRLTHFARTILNSAASKKDGGKSGVKRAATFASDAITLVQSSTSTINQPPLASMQEDPKRTKSVDTLSTTLAYPMPGALPQSEA